MIVDFYKYQGTGNDFIMINDCNNVGFFLTEKSIKKLCHRRFGIGADGLIILTKSVNLDFEMLYYNADGKIGSMCGNGGRCTVAFAKFLNLISNHCTFVASDGNHVAQLNEDGEIALEMKNVDHVELQNGDYILNTGSPHYVRFVDDVAAIDMVTEGKKIRYNEQFITNGINVNFAEIRPNEIIVRTYERGVEDETYSCGTGVTAVAICASLRHHENKPYSFNISTLGGNLNVSFNKITSNEFNHVFLKGAAILVYQGTIEI